MVHVIVPGYPRKSVPFKGRQCELSVKKGGNTGLQSRPLWDEAFFYSLFLVHERKNCYT